MNEKEIEKIEQEIADSIKKEITNLSWREQEKRIGEEIKKRNYLSEDWQIHYAVDRVKEILNKSDLEIHAGKKLSLKMVFLTILIMVISFLVMMASLNIDNPALKGGLIMASFASFVYPIKMWWKSFISKG